MRILCPPIDWPSFLEECGPAEDPEIVLKGTVRVGGTPLEVVAIRIDPRRRGMPDYKLGVPEAAYQTAALETTLEELEFVTQELGPIIGAAQRSVVHLTAGPYLICVLPAQRTARPAPIAVYRRRR